MAKWLHRARKAPHLILSMLGLAVWATCETQPQFSLDSLGAGGFTHNGITYAVQLDDAGNLVVTMEDGTSFTVGPKGDVTQAISDAGAKLDLQYDGDNVNVNTYFPEFDDAAKTRAAIKNNAAAESGETVCDGIQEGCEALTVFVDVILPELEPAIVLSYHDRYQAVYDLETVQRFVHAHIEQVSNRIREFCSGWGLLVLLNQNPCDESAGGPCPSVAGVWEATYDTGLELTLRMTVDGTSGTGKLERPLPFGGGVDETGHFTRTLTGTLSQGSSSCAECMVFEGEFTSPYDVAVDDFAANADPAFVPPVRTFSIVFDADARSAQGTLYEDDAEHVTISALRIDCN